MYYLLAVWCALMCFFGSCPALCAEEVSVVNGSPSAVWVGDDSGIVLWQSQGEAHYVFSGHCYGGVTAGVTNLNFVLSLDHVYRVAAGTNGSGPAFLSTDIIAGQSTRLFWAGFTLVGFIGAMLIAYRMLHAYIGTGISED